MRTYKKTYIRKKTGEVVTKTYKVRKAEDKDILITGNGTETKTRGGKTKIDKYLEQFGDDPTALAARKNIIRKLKRDQKMNKEITIKTVESALAKDSRDKFLINAGYTAEEAARELGVTLEEFYDEKNWDHDAKGRIGSKFTSPTGAVFQFQFKYTGSIWKRL